MPHEIIKLELDALAQRFERFARRECQVSPLYERLSFGIAQDPELLAIAAQARPGQPVPNLFLAAVHFLLLQGRQHPLAAFYPSLSPAAPRTADPYPHFRSFCLEHQGKVLELISTRLVQTNEVRRCACLLPAFAAVAAHRHGRPLALVEIGTSAGLNLLWDRYGYEYGTGRRYGDPRSPVQIGCTLRGHRLPPLPAALPPVATRIGIDLNPIDVRDPDAALWLRALVWPDEAGRAELLQQALQIAQQDPPRLLAGNAPEQLPEALAAIPDDQTLCVFHTHTMNQFPTEARASLAALLTEHAVARDLYRVSIEWLGREHPRLECVAFENGVRTERLLAHCGSHGEWLEWLGHEG
ncbi:MAG TPA: DUF2332 domain-containing protein [Candidatus Tectomicrobia bacterium]|nr:DUF2332 domain-containing protein [Candidatus Tectomicrobia bacterium]